MNNEIKNELRITMNAHIPCLAIQSPETEPVLEAIVHSACGTFTNTPRVLVWRVAVGFEEYAGYVQNTETNEEHEITQGISNLSPEIINVKRTGKIEASEEDFPGCQVPFAVQFMTDYNTDLEGRQVIFVLRDWHNFIDSNTEHIDKQLILFESILSMTNLHCD